MLNIVHYYRNAYQNYSEVSPYINQNGHYQKNLQKKPLSFHSYTPIENQNIFLAYFPTIFPLN